MFSISKKLALATLIFCSGQFSAFGSDGGNDEFGVNRNHVLKIEGPEVINETGKNEHAVEQTSFCKANDPNIKCLPNDVIKLILKWSFIDQESFNAEEHYVVEAGERKLILKKEDTDHIKNIRLVCKGFYQYVNSKVTIFFISNPYNNPNFVEYEDKNKMLIGLLPFRPNLKVLSVQNCTFFKRELLCEAISKYRALKVLDICNSNITDEDLINFTNRFDGDLTVILLRCNTLTEAVFARLSEEKKNRKIFFHICGCENITRGLTVDPNGCLTIKHYNHSSGCSIC